MATSLVLHERIQTTLPKAKELRGLVERMITLGKRGDLSARRLAAAFLYDDAAVGKVFSELATRFKNRPGGYTRILRKGFRFGDGADMAFLELVDFQEQKEKSEKSKADAKAAEAAPKKVAKKKTAAKAEA